MLENNKIEEYSNEIIENFKSSEKDELIIVCIGTDKVIGDSIAPMSGTFIKEKNNNISIYGTLEYPVHALNIHERLEEIYNSHPNAYIIGIDACLGDEKDIGEIRLRDCGIKAGNGVGKKLPQVGNMSIIGIIGSESSLGIFGSGGIRLSLVWDMAKSIERIIENTYNKLNEIDDIAITV